MKDAVSISIVRLLHPAIRDEVAELIGKIEVNNPKFIVRIAQGLRTFEEQAKLYNQGRTTPGNIVTNAKPGSSYHQYGLAIDFCLLYDKFGSGKYDTVSWDVDADEDRVKDWREVVNMFKAHGYTWGGDFHSIVDNPHLEKSFGLKVSELLNRYNAKQFIPDTQYVKL